MVLRLLPFPRGSAQFRRKRCDFLVGIVDLGAEVIEPRLDAVRNVDGPFHRGGEESTDVEDRKDSRR